MTDYRYQIGGSPTVNSPSGQTFLTKNICQLIIDYRKEIENEVISISLV